jgi:hypothetical protein
LDQSECKDTISSDPFQIPKRNIHPTQRGHKNRSPTIEPTPIRRLPYMLYITNYPE